MAKSNIVEYSLEIPKEVQATVNGFAVSVSGPKGKSSKVFSLRGLEISLSNGKILLRGALCEANTAKKHILNMFEGCAKGYVRKMKIIYAHFPISVSLKGKEIEIKNFIGERKPRVSRVMGDTKVEVKGQSITVSGPDKDDVGQTVANLRIATKIVGRDSRVFQDGIYPVEE
ncbi:MAG: 50S ribosomal protein L6 [Candidatus Micrarchaeota archaeon]